MDPRASDRVQFIQWIMSAGPEMQRENFRGIFDLSVDVMAFFDLADAL